MEANETVQNAIEPLWPEFHAAVEDGNFERLTSGQRAVMMAWVLSGLVDNGGFASWIEGMGHRSSVAIESLETLGADEYVRLINDALQLYPQAGEGDHDSRSGDSRSWTDTADEALTDLDNRFYALGGDRDLIDYYAFRYVTSVLRQRFVRYFLRPSRI